MVLIHIYIYLQLYTHIIIQQIIHKNVADVCWLTGDEGTSFLKILII